VRLRSQLTGHRLRPRVLRRTIRVRLAVLFFAVFLVSGAALLAVTVAVWQGRTGTVHVAHAPAGSLAHPAIGVTQHSSDRQQLLIASGIALAVIARLSVALGWLMAGAFLAPLRTITTRTRRISATNLHERLNLAGPDDELKELGDTFDELLARLERAFQFERRFVANASHELRTPLAGMRTSLDVAMAKSGPVPPQFLTLAGRLRRELDHVDRLLESFLMLAHTEQGPVADQSTISLAELARLTIERHAGAISATALDVERENGHDVWVTGSETLLSRMVENVIDNSISHNQPGGWVRVGTAVEGQFARLSVENGGPVLDPDDVKDLTQPFRRVGAQRTGSDKGIGLGLAIVASIAEVHGGTLDLQALSGGGLRVVITLPLAIRTAARAPA
jgi:signal transduction histidine kinase